MQPMLLKQYDFIACYFSTLQSCNTILASWRHAEFFNSRSIHRERLDGSIGQRTTEHYILKLLLREENCFLERVTDDDCVPSILSNKESYVK